MFVPQYFTMNPETDELFMDGTSLEVGMVVLVEDSNWRSAIHPHTGQPRIYSDTKHPEVMIDRARRWNRWMKIVRMQRTDRVKFIAESVDDGDRLLYDMSMSEGWYVKKDSIEPNLAKDEYLQGWRAGLQAGEGSVRTQLVYKHREELAREYNRGFVDGAHKVAKSDGTENMVIQNKPVFVDEAVEEEQSGTVIRDVKEDTYIDDLREENKQYHSKLAQAVDEEKK